MSIQTQCHQSASRQSCGASAEVPAMPTARPTFAASSEIPPKFMAVQVARQTSGASVEIPARIPTMPVARQTSGASVEIPAMPAARSDAGRLSIPATSRSTRTSFRTVVPGASHPGQASSTTPRPTTPRLTAVERLTDSTPRSSLGAQTAAALQPKPIACLSVGVCRQVTPHFSPRSEQRPEARTSLRATARVTNPTPQVASQLTH